MLAYFGGVLTVLVALWHAVGVDLWAFNTVCRGWFGNAWW
ncbi:hypothetical protein SAMN04487818_10250 [Actinokineospora terrae]|uniref:Uncharacterized protein n=1 Tax=Actinokineospora terrae TaxID=155974 RepID=A0A1H9MAR7_9PSEU|nr:hypothetical protein SAMN04487818_10250 [Actinokineospora terrae]